MKRIFLTLCLLMLTAVAVGQAIAPLPEDDAFDQLVELNTGVNGEALDVMIEALGRAIGYTVITGDTSSEIVSYSIAEPRPFRQVWDLILTLHDLDYMLEDNNLFVVGPRHAIAGLRGSRTPTLDAVPREQRIYALSNAEALELAQVLQEAIAQGDLDLGEVPARAEYLVAADQRTNSLIITATAAMHESLDEIIKTLDRAQRQVNVQVRIQEINASAATSLGLNVRNAGIGNLSATLLDSGLSFIFNTATVLSSFNIHAVLDALEVQGLSRRVDDANITVLDNLTGKIRSGGTVWTTVVSTGEDGTASLMQIPYGVTIDVRPRIGSDGTITLEVNTLIDDIQPVPSGDVLFHTSTREAQSTITVQTGQTVLLGGLMQSQETIQKERIPILGHLPLIGDLFGYTSTQDDSRELFLIVTAQVIE